MNICHVFMFLTGHLMVGASGRNGYLAVLRDMAEKYKKRPFALVTHQLLYRGSKSYIWL
jgi:hypothetical protein